MKASYSVKLSKIMKSHNLQTLYLPQDASEIAVTNTEVNRPGLQMAGFYEYFDPERVQVFGKSEFAFLREFEPEDVRLRINTFFSKHPVAVVLANGLSMLPEIEEAAKKYKCPVLGTELATSEFVSSLISMLHVELAPRLTQHGVFVEVHGEGILLLGESGVGKSETAIELIKRGHRLIADDAVEIRRVSAKTLVGSAPENIRHFMELRGIGVINIRRIFGMGAVKITQQVDMVINLEPWDNDKVYDRMGLNSEFTEIMGNRVPVMTIPVKPGRNLAVIIEVAAMNNRQKKLGYNSAKELLERLGLEDDLPKPTEPTFQWD